MAEASPGANIGRNVRAVRERKLFSRTDLAERSGVSLAGIDHLERGLSSRPRRGTIEKLAEALDVDVDALLEDAPPLAEAPPSQGPLFHNGGLEERGPLTAAETNAIETLAAVCEDIEGFLDDYLPSNRGTVSGTNLMTSMRLLARVTAGLTLPYMESAAMRPAILPTATRFVEMVHRLEREAKESGDEADEEAENVIYLFERSARAS